MIEDKKVLLVNVDTLKNTADALTKSMSSEKYLPLMYANLKVLEGFF